MAVCVECSPTNEDEEGIGKRKKKNCTWQCYFSVLLAHHSWFATGTVFVCTMVPSQSKWKQYRTVRNTRRLHAMRIRWHDKMYFWCVKSQKKFSALVFAHISFLVIYSFALVEPLSLLLAQRQRRLCGAHHRRWIWLLFKILASHTIRFACSGKHSHTTVSLTFFRYVVWCAFEKGIVLSPSCRQKTHFHRFHQASACTQSNVECILIPRRVCAQRIHYTRHTPICRVSSLFCMLVLHTHVYVCAIFGGWLACTTWNVSSQANNERRTQK